MCHLPQNWVMLPSCDANFPSLVRIWVIKWYFMNINEWNFFKYERVGVECELSICKWYYCLLTNQPSCQSKVVEYASLMSFICLSHITVLSFSFCIPSMINAKSSYWLYQHLILSKHIFMMFISLKIIKRNKIRRAQLHLKIS